MSVQDAKQILTGGDDAATQYFKRVTYAPLQVKFTPIVTRETQKVQLGQRARGRPESGESGCVEAR
jgi:hypothetical protein